LVSLFLVLMLPTTVSAQESPFPASLPSGETLDKFLLPLATRGKSPKVTIDFSETPDLKPWAERAQKLAQDWWPMLAPLLATDRFQAPAELKIVFKESLEPPAQTQGNTITVKGPWVRNHPEDFGVVIHEMVHVIQSYPSGGNKPGWLVEGIADYIRWW